MTLATERERDLAQRLAEADATIEALLTGQIDAVVDAESTTPVLLAEAQAALSVAEERMRFALSSANVGIWDMNYVTDLLRWSDVLEAQYGLEPGSFSGSLDAFVALIHIDDRESVLETMRNANRAGGDFAVLHRTTWPNGTVRWLSGTGKIVLDARGQPLRGVGISQDVTDRKLLESQYLQTQRMDAVGQLAAGIAHDFNNVLSVILSSGEFLREDLGRLDPRRADVEEICNAGRRAAALTRQLLIFSRQQVLAPKVVDLANVIADMEGMLRRLVGEDVELHFPDGGPIGRVRADVGSIEQVVMNLVVNARDAMPSGGRLTIETRNEVVDERLARQLVGGLPGRYVVLAVRDTGKGMDEATQARIFEPFFTTKGVGRGTGLGLATVFGIVQQSHGAIGVESTAGAGSRFSIYLPRVDAELELDTSSIPAAASHGTGMILIVEDADPVRAAARTILVRKGYRVVDLATPADALKFCEESPEAIDLLLTDVVMPLMSGPELASRLAGMCPQTKVLYMSGYNGDDVLRHGVLEGDPLVQKPFTPESLARGVRDVLSPVPSSPPADYVSGGRMARLPL
jgi:PAS domain S-box-containing protein